MGEWESHPECEKIVLTFEAEDIPSSIAGRTARIDFDDINLRKYSVAFIRDKILRRWVGLKVLHVSDAVPATPEGISCEPRKL